MRKRVCRFAFDARTFTGTFVVELPALAAFCKFFRLLNDDKMKRANQYLCNGIVLCLPYVFFCGNHQQQNAQCYHR